MLATPERFARADRAFWYDLLEIDSSKWIAEDMLSVLLKTWLLSLKNACFSIQCALAGAEGSGKHSPGTDEGPVYLAAGRVKAHGAKFSR